MSDLSFLTVVELGGSLRGREVSAVELARHFLDRLERLGPAYNAVVDRAPRAGPRRGGSATANWRRGTTGGRCTAFPTAPRICSPRAGAPDDLGGAPLSRADVQGRRHRDAAAARGRRRAGAPSWRWSSWLAGWDTTRPSPASPARADAVGHVALVGGIVERVGRLGGRGARALRDRLGDLGIDPVPGRLLRCLAACARPTAGSAATARWRSAGRWTSWARCAAPPRIAASCWRPSPAPTPTMPPRSLRVAAGTAGGRRLRHPQGNARQDAAGGA